MLQDTHCTGMMAVAGYNAPGLWVGKEHEHMRLHDLQLGSEP